MLIQSAMSLGTTQTILPLCELTSELPMAYGWHVENGGMVEF